MGIIKEWRGPFANHYEDFEEISRIEYHLSFTLDWATGGVIFKNLTTDKTAFIALRTLEDTPAYEMRDLIRRTCLTIATKHTPRTKWNCTNHGSPISNL